MNHSKLVVVGAGQIGTPLVERLAREGHRVVWVSRSKPSRIPNGVTHVALDARHGAELARLATGARAIIAAANPPSYDAAVWKKQLVPLTAGLLDGARLSGSRLVLLDGLYMYALDRGPLSPATPQEPATEKGKIRKALADMVVAAQREGVRAVSLRASDFLGAGLARSLLNASAIERIKQGKSPLLIGDPDVPHAFSMRDDVIDALVQLAFAPDDVEGQVFHAPVVHETTRNLVEREARTHGTAIEVRAMPGWLLRIAGLFSRDTRGLVEMLPQWSAPYLVDDSSYRKRFQGPRAALSESVTPGDADG